jgi:hypothetical protein
MNLRVIPTSVHAVTDYVTGPVLAAAPDLFRFGDGGASAVAPRLAGAGATAYSAFTDYELGVRRLIPMRLHLALDAGSGALLAATPWVFGSARRGTRYWLPHAVVGGMEIAMAAMTRTQEPRARPRRARRLWNRIRRR